MNRSQCSRRDFLKTGFAISVGAVTGSLPIGIVEGSSKETKAVVSITRIKNDKVDAAIEEAIDLLGGIRAVTRGKDRIMLKPNLVAEGPGFTTKPEVIKTLARLMKDAGKDVSIGEGSASAGGFNIIQGETFRTRNPKTLDGMQQYVFDKLGYTELAKSMRIPLINLHSGEMVDVPISGGYAYDKISLHHSLTEIDTLCSVPMMKTHGLATVTLGMKNLIGLYPGTVYSSVRAGVHDHAAKAGSPGVAYEIVDMVKANKVGLVVVDGSMAMEGNGPTSGTLVKMGVIVAGTNPLATDMVAAKVMGFETSEVPTFVYAHKAGMKPTTIDDIEVRGESISNVMRKFRRPNIVPWSSISHLWGVKNLPSG